MISNKQSKQGNITLLLICFGLNAFFQPVTGQETKGVRPYELDWAGRVTDDHKPLVNFENVNGRGSWFETSAAASDGKLIILKKEDGSRELIPHGTEKFAIALEKKPKSIIALDADRNEIGLAGGKLLDGYFHVKAVKGAFSYMIKI